MDDASDTTLDAFYDGRLLLRQPSRGHRSGSDAVLLAAAVQRDFSGLCHDVGAGVGVAGLGIALRCTRARVCLIENEPGALALATTNVAANALGARASVVACDILDAVSRRAAIQDLADLVVTNPPFHAAGRVRASGDGARRAAHVLPEEVTLRDWIAACRDGLASKGELIVIHAAAALPDILAAMDRSFGAITVLAIHPRAGTSAKRILVRGKRGSRSPLTIAAPLVLHDGDGFTPLAASLHRGEVGLDW